MRRIFTTITILAMCALCSFAFIDGYTLDRSDLPQEAQDMLSEHFPKAKIGMIKIDGHLLKKTDYDVRLTNGTTIEFNNKGSWTSVNCNKREVPSSLVPSAIARSVKKNYSDVTIVSIKKTLSKYEIGLSDGVVLEYDRLFQLKGVKIQEE